MKTKRRFLGNLLGIALCMALCIGLMPLGALAADPATVYDVWVGGVQITSDNADDVFDDGKVSYDVATETLILNGYSYEGIGYEYYSEGESYTAVIYSKNSIVVEAEGYNQLKNTYENTTEDKYGDGIVSNETVAIKGSGSLHVASSYGVYAGENVTISEGVGIEIIATDSGVCVKTGNVAINDSQMVIETEAEGIFAEGDVTISGGAKVNIEAETDGIFNVNGDVTITDSEVKIKAKTDGIYAYDGSVNINSKKVTPGKYGPRLTGTTVSISAGGTHGIFAYKGLTISDRLTISTPEDGKVDTLTKTPEGEEEYTYGAVVNKEGKVATEIEIEPLGYEVRIKKLSFEMAVPVPAGQSMNETYGEDFESRFDTTKEGYTFGGWYTDENCTAGNEFTFDEKITADVTIYPKWVEPSNDSENKNDDANVNDTSDNEKDNEENNQENNQEEVSPQTGDNSNLWLWIVLMLLCGGCVFSVAVYGKIEKK